MDEHAPLYQHTKRPEWGYGAIVEVHDDRTTFKFDDGATRSISRNYIHMMREVELAEPEASEARKKIGKLAPLKPAGADAKPKKTAAKKKVAAAQT